MNISNNFKNEKEQLAKMIKNLRTQSGLSQRELSEKTGIVQSDISKIERAVSNPSLTTILRLMQAMDANLTMDYELRTDYRNIDVEIAKNIDPKYLDICNDSAKRLKKVMHKDLEEVVLYGSCARGENTEDSDVDIALITGCDYEASEKYLDTISSLSATFMSKYYEMVNFIFIPSKDYHAKRDWYPFYNNIWREGIVIYGRD